ncbi:MAG: tetratricopeptide repeat protein [Pirellulales bacterium]
MKFKDYYRNPSLLLIACAMCNLCGCLQSSGSGQQDGSFERKTEYQSLSSLPRKFNPVENARSLQPTLSDAVIASGVFEEYPVPIQHAQPLLQTPDLEPQGPEFFAPHPVSKNPSSVATDDSSIKNQIKPNSAPVNKLESSRPVNLATSSIRPKKNPVFHRELQRENPLTLHAIEAIRARAQSLTDHGFSLAQRGAYFSARAEFIQALRLLSQTLDTHYQTHQFSQSLANGLLAMKEAEDFIPKGSQLEANVDMQRMVESHKTPVLQDVNLAKVTPIVAVQQYYAYAQKQLGQTGLNIPEASNALFGLGKIQPYLHSGNGRDQSMTGPRSVAIYQAAMIVDGKNAAAANELGVMLARYGQLGDAKQVFLQGIQATPQVESWNNLAKVHDALGEYQLAGMARNEALYLEQLPKKSNVRDVVEWTSVEQFTQQGRPQIGHQQATRSPRQSPAFTARNQNMSFPSR